MKRKVLVVLMVVALVATMLVGCGKSKDTVVGKWYCDEEETYFEFSKGDKLIFSDGPSEDVWVYEIISDNTILIVYDNFNSETVDYYFENGNLYFDDMELVRSK